MECRDTVIQEKYGQRGVSSMNVKQLLSVGVMHKFWMLLHSQEGDLKEASEFSNLRRLLIEGLLQRPTWSREGKLFNFFVIFQ